MKKSIAIMLMLAIFTALFTGCGKYQTVEDTPVVMTVNGEEIRAFEVAKAMKNQMIKSEEYYTSLMNQIGGNIDDIWEKDEVVEALRDQGVQDVLNSRAFDQLIMENNITLSDDQLADIESYKERAKSSYKTDEAFIQYLKENNYTQESYDAMLKKTFLKKNLEDLYFAVDGKEPPSDNEIKDYFDKYYYTTKHLQVVLADEKFEKIEDEKRQERIDKAKEFADRVKNGEDFDKLLAEYSKIDGFSSGIQTFAGGDDILSEYINAVYKMEIGDFSEVIESTYSCYVIERVDNPDNALTDGTLNFNKNKTIRDEIALKIASIDKVLEKTVEGYDVEKMDELSKITIKNLDKYLVE